MTVFIAGSIGRWGLLAGGTARPARTKEDRLVDGRRHDYTYCTSQRWTSIDYESNSIVTTPGLRGLCVIRRCINMYLLNG